MEPGDKKRAKRKRIKTGAPFLEYLKKKTGDCMSFYHEGLRQERVELKDGIVVEIQVEVSEETTNIARYCFSNQTVRK